MYFKHKVIVSLQDIYRLSPNVRKDLEANYKLEFEDLLKWHEKGNDRAIDQLIELSKSYDNLNQKYETENESLKSEAGNSAYHKSIRNHITPSRFQDKITYQIIEQLSVKIIEAAKELNLPIKNIPIFGTLHTEQVNACAIKVSNSEEFIIVFESQLFHFLNRFNKLLIQSLPLKDSRDGQYSFSAKIEDIKLHLDSNPIIQETFNQLMWSFVVEGNVKKAQNWMIEKPWYMMATYTLRATELFIMGHELGHIIKGHLNSDTGNPLQFSDVKGSQMNLNWEKEFEADTVGLFLSIEVLRKENFREDFCLIGAELHFIISEIVNKAFSIINNGNEHLTPTSNTHPPVEMRRENIRNSLKSIFNNEQFEDAKFFPDLIEQVLYSLWDNSKQQFYDYYTSKSQ